MSASPPVLRRLALSGILAAAVAVALSPGASAQRVEGNGAKAAKACTARAAATSKATASLRVARPARPAARAACADPILDGGFETGGIPNSFWNPETSTNFGTPLCDVPSCGTGGGASPPYAGAFWAWFGGIPAPETATLGQTVVIPAGGVATLSWQMRIGTVSSPFTDVLNVRVDGVIQTSYPEPTVPESSYTTRSINLGAFANGASHAILFEYIGPSQGTGSYVVDNVQLICATTAVSVASTAAARTARGVNVRWTTGADTNILGFRVYRGDGPNRVRVTKSMIRALGFAAGSRYNVVDRTAPQGRKLRYWIEVLHLDGSSSWHGPATVAA
jgi:hypothetical protein